MFTRIFAAAAFALAFAQVPAGAAIIAPEGVERAAEACLTINEYAPVQLVASVEDGLGDWLIWVKDKDGDLWMCNANSRGAVFTNVLMQGDLLDGAGAELLGYRPIANRSHGNAAQTAEAVCLAVGSYIEEMQIIATVDDGMGDYLVWLKNANEELWVCNASAGAELYDFEPIDMPLNDVEPLELRYA